MKLKEPLIYKNLESRFEKYLLDKDNNQILFSGPFGSGKTTFLRSFFNGQENYNVFRVFPVNYVLHENSDVFEILKYDVIMELIEKKAFTVPDIDKLTKYIFSVSQSLDHAVGKIIGLFSDTGKSIVEVAEVMEKSLAKNQEGYEKLADPLLSVRQFLNTVKSYKKYTHNDYVTSVIQEKLNKLCTGGEKQNVLIVDDMDRIDPEHLFRIISIFSSHIDMETGANKFGFDKIIFVGDNENFRSMFLYKYGIVNNYNAYISKLCSKSPFIFDPDRELYEKISTIVEGIKFKFDYYGEIFSAYHNVAPPEKRFFNYLLCSLINSGAISLRELVKLQGTHNIHGRYDGFISELKNSVEQFSLFHFAILINIIIPNGKITALQGLFENPLPCDRIINHGGVHRVTLISTMSMFPLEFFFAGRNFDVKQLGTTEVMEIGGKDISIIISKNDAGIIHTRIAEIDASEYNLYLVTVEAIKKMQFYIR